MGLNGSDIKKKRQEKNIDNNNNNNKIKLDNKDNVMIKIR